VADRVTVAETLGPLPAIPVHVGLGYYPEGTDIARWDTAHWDADNWVGDPPVEDITCNVVKVSIARGRDLPLERFRPGTCNVEVHDPDGRWSPWRTAFDSTVYTTVRPGIELAVWCDIGGVRKNRFVGIVDAISDSFTVPGDNRSHHVTFQALDYSSLLAAYDGVEQAPQGFGELAGARLTRITDNAGYHEPRAFDEGTVALQATTLAKNALDETGIVTDTEMGALWCDADGVLQFRDRNGLISDPHYTEVQATFGEEAPEICYSDLLLTTDLERLKNIVGIANEGGTMVTRTDTTSISLYRPRTYKRTDLINVADAQNAVIAQRHLDFYAYAASRIEHLTVELPMLATPAQEIVLALMLLWRIQVRRRAAGFQVVADLQIQGIGEDITASTWTIRYSTFDATAIFKVGRWDIDVWDTGLWGY
jgi:hypothetical protein